MRVTQKTGSTNLRYGRPWIARITDWPTGGKPKLEFGGWTGTGTAGCLEIEAQPGDVIRWCVKGYRDKEAWCIVTDCGQLSEVTALAAREHWVQRQAEVPNPGSREAVGEQHIGQGLEQGMNRDLRAQVRELVLATMRSIADGNLDQALAQLRSLLQFVSE